MEGKKRWTSAALMLCIFIGASFADGEEIANSKPPARPPLPTWTGFYAGLNAGGLWSHSGTAPASDWARLTTPGSFSYSANFAALPPAGFAVTGAPGFIGGGQIGYNWQATDNIVVGLEADFQGIAGGATSRDAGWASGSTATRAPNSIGSVRGRAGYLIAPNLQVYGTGGLSYSGGK